MKNRENIGYISYFSPDGRVSGQSGGNEFSGANNEGGKLYLMLMFLYKNVLEVHVAAKYEFVIFLDNYFTYPKTIKAFRDLGVGIAGTGRLKRGWPPACLKVSEEPLFNDLYYCVDDDGTLVMRWVDNNTVLMVSTVHNPESNILKDRRRPRLTNTNNSHVSAVWGVNHVRQIKIPGAINDYNKYMNGVDLADQRISSYSPNFRCRRTWMPLFLQCLNIVRNNSYILYKENGNENIMQKNFIYQLCESLSSRANSLSSPIYRNLRSHVSTNVSGVAEILQSRRLRRMTKKNFQLPQNRFKMPRSLHTTIFKNKQSRCVYCASLRAQRLKNGFPALKSRHVQRACGYCDVPLCKDHFDLFHTPGN